jgi:hypothetical protein
MYNPTINEQQLTLFDIFILKSNGTEEYSYHYNQL